MPDPRTRNAESALDSGCSSSLSYRFPIAIADTQYQTPDLWVAAIAIAECDSDRNSLPIVLHHFPIAKSDVLNMDAITFLSQDPVWTGSEPLNLLSLLERWVAGWTRSAL